MAPQTRISLFITDEFAGERGILTKIFRRSGRREDFDQKTGTARSKCANRFVGWFQELFGQMPTCGAFRECGIINI